MPQTQDTDENVIPVGGLVPRTADTHVSVLTRTEPVVPERRGIWPLAPWRAIVLTLAILFAVLCGIPAADPVWNGADLGVLISLGLFVAAFTPGRD